MEMVEERSVTKNINNANGANGTAAKTRWSETNHVFATPHPAHELIKSQTAYGRDVKEGDVVIDAKPDGYDRITMPNLIPSDMLTEAERLCRMHNVDLRDEWRFAQIEMTKAIINELSNRPVPEGYKEPGSRKRRISSMSDEQKAKIDAAKAELKKLREEGKRIREEAKAKQEAIKKELTSAKPNENVRMNGASDNGASDSGFVAPTDANAGNGVTVLSDVLANPPVAPPDPAPVAPKKKTKE